MSFEVERSEEIPGSKSQGVESGERGDRKISDLLGTRYNPRPLEDLWDRSKTPPPIDIPQ